METCCVYGSMLGIIDDSEVNKKQSPHLLSNKTIEKKGMYANSNKTIGD